MSESEDVKRVLVVGDVMVDRYFYVGSTRQAPEAPIPVWDKIEHENRLGGAANVAHNLKALGGEDIEVFLAGIVENEAKKMIGKIGINTILCAGFDTMYKDRYVDKNTMKIVFRCDNIKEFHRQSLETFEEPQIGCGSVLIHENLAARFNQFCTPHDSNAFGARRKP